MSQLERHLSKSNPSGTGAFAAIDTEPYLTNSNNTNARPIAGKANSGGKFFEFGFHAIFFNPPGLCERAHGPRFPCAGESVVWFFLEITRADRI